MKIVNIDCLVFSPTGGCLKIAKSIKKAIESKTTEYSVNLSNITTPDKREHYINVAHNVDYLIIVYPVYADTLPDLLKEFLERVFLKSVPITLVAGFGNVQPGKALSIVKKIVEEKSCVVNSACAIVTAHSYNGDSLKIAENEPTDEKLEILNSFILESIEKALRAKSLSSCETKIPEGHMRLVCRAPQKLMPQIFIKKPVVDWDLCNHCMICANHCPAGAIDSNLKIDNKKCIRCLACVKYCGKKARVFETRTKVLISTLKKDERKIHKNEYYI
jgi:ferredoxin/putative NADPH-quinone reductase